jgi:endonuclease-3
MRVKTTIVRYSDSVPTLTVPLVISELQKLYKPPRSFLNWETPEQLLLATILSAQCTDDRVNLVTKSLFKKYTKLEKYLTVPITELEKE